MAVCHTSCLCFSSSELPWCEPLAFALFWPTGFAACLSFPVVPSGHVHTIPHSVRSDGLSYSFAASSYWLYSWRKNREIRQWWSFRPKHSSLASCERKSFHCPVYQVITPVSWLWELLLQISRATNVRATQPELIALGAQYIITSDIFSTIWLSFGRKKQFLNKKVKESEIEICLIWSHCV